MVVIFLGLGLLAAEFVWARRLMERIKHEGGL
jgi:Putative transmembrane protein (PGPGW)